MKIKSSIILLSIILCSSVSHAIIKESLDKAVGEIENKYRSIDGLTANFTQKTYVAVLEKEISNFGSITWKKPGKLFIEYRGERPKQYISNNEHLWIYVPGDTQVEVYKISENTVSKEALEFMRGFGNIRNLYKITGWEKGKNYTDLTLIPLSNAPYSKLQCRFGKENLLESVVIFNTSGNKSTYVFSNISVNVPVSDDLFEFRKPKGVRAVHIK